MPRHLKPRSALSSSTREKQRHLSKAQKNQLNAEQELLNEMSKICRIYEMRARNAVDHGPLGLPDAKIENKQDPKLKLYTETGSNAGWEFTANYYHHAKILGQAAVNDPDFWDISEYPEPDENESTLN